MNDKGKKGSARSQKLLWLLEAQYIFEIASLGGDEGEAVFGMEFDGLEDVAGLDQPGYAEGKKSTCFGIESIALAC
jgi:hypothetical protein